MKKICQICEEPFETKNPIQKCCSGECSHKLETARSRKYTGLTSFAVFRRDGFRCAYCGKTAYRHNITLHLDHIVASTNNGRSMASNVITSCISCNEGKAARDTFITDEILDVVKNRNAEYGILPNTPIRQESNGINSGHYSSKLAVLMHYYDSSAYQAIKTAVSREYDYIMSLGETRSLTLCVNLSEMLTPRCWRSANRRIAMVYRGYEVIERVFQYASIGGKDDKGLILNAPCGCGACMNEVQVGHFACDSYPEWMDYDDNLCPRLVGNEWVWEYIGPVQ